MERGVTAIRLRYVNQFSAKGRVYYYFRRPGLSAVKLPGLPGSEEFMTAYQAALTEAPRPIGEARTLPGTVNAAVAAYYQSLAFRELAQSTRYMRRCYLEKFREQHGDKRLALMPSDFIARMLDRLEPFSARNWLKSLRALMQHAVSTGLCKADPTQGIKLRTP